MSSLIPLRGWSGEAKYLLWKLTHPPSVSPEITEFQAERKLGIIHTTFPLADVALSQFAIIILNLCHMPGAGGAASGMQIAATANSCQQCCQNDSFCPELLHSQVKVGAYAQAWCTGPGRGLTNYRAV
jgi:hypothetical protein